VYIDTHVLAYRLLTSYNAGLQSKSVKFFKDIETGKYRGIVSTLTRLEYRGVVKKVLSNYCNRAISAYEEQVALDDFDEFLENMGIGLVDADLLSRDSSGMISDIIQKSEDILIPASPIYNPRAMKCPWTAMGGADALITNLAIRCDADYLATFDRGFKGLNSPYISTIIVPEVY